MIQLELVGDLSSGDKRKSVRKSNTLKKLGAEDFLRAKTGIRISKPEISSRFKSFTKSNSLKSLDPLTIEGQQELIAHMKNSETGIKFHATRGSSDRYFTVRALTEWVSANVPNSGKLKGIEIIQSLFDNEYVESLDGEDTLFWFSNPGMKLKFKEYINPLFQQGLRLHLSYSEISETETDDIEESELFTSQEEDLKSIAEKMKQPNSGLKIKTRKWLLKRYPNCFVGEQAVTWLVYHLEIQREEALKIGQQMLEQNLFCHVTNDHPFLDKYLFYKFTR